MALGLVTVFGGSGFVGSAIVERLAHEGADVRIAVRHPERVRAAATSNRGGRIMPVRVLDSDGSGNTSGLADGIIWAVDHGADVISMSLSALQTTTVLEAAIDYALQRGVVPVAAAGNTYQSGSPKAYPAALT
ncbi:MAG: S8 family serine peptidase, partial [Pseudomonadota bacterium]|nr:S8 family serine peptidase [Pseudomonadota bacterium]